MKIAESMGMEVIKHELFYVPLHPLNPTAITIIRKTNSLTSSHILACPEFKTPLEFVGGALFSHDACRVYPIIGGIPCLRSENGIVASKYRDVVYGDVGSLSRV